MLEDIQQPEDGTSLVSILFAAGSLRACINLNKEMPNQVDVVQAIAQKMPKRCPPGRNMDLFLQVSVVCVMLL